MATLYDLLDTVAQQCTIAINAAGITTPAQGFKGFPVAEDLTQVLAQQQYMVSVYDHGGKQGLRYIGNAVHQIAASSPNLTVTVTQTSGTIAFGYIAGQTTIQAGVNVHTFVGSLGALADVWYQALGTDTPTSIATAVSAAINLAAVPGVSATASGASVTVTGSPALKCNVGGTATFAKEAGRQKRIIQVSVWAPNQTLRQSVGEAILENVGPADIPFITLPDGTITWFRYDNDAIIDESQSDYSLYEWHIVYEAELPVLRQFTAYEVLGYNAQTTTPTGTTTKVGG